MGVGARPPYFLTRLSKGSLSGSGSMNRLLAIRAATAVAGGLLLCSPAVAQNLPPAPRAQHVEIIKGPALEISHDDLAIVRWMTIITPSYIMGRIPMI
jgi:hypothetical protein